MISAQQMADRFSPALLTDLSKMAGEIRAIPLADCDGHRRSSDIVAGAWVQSVSTRLTRARIHRAFDEDAIRDYAENYARLCRGMKSYESRTSFLVSQRISPPSGPHMTREGACRRMGEPRWWRRQLRKSWTRSSEDALRDIGLIRAGRMPYASDQAVQYISQRHARQREWMERVDLVSEDGEVLNMLTVHDHSLANPALRRGEFMCRLRGFEELAAHLKHDALFITLTAPSAFHAQLRSGGRNPAYERETVRDAQRWLCRMWSRFRARMKRLAVEFYGFRVAEPHHDGTPHWHAVLFFPPEHAETIGNSLRNIWLSEFPNEPGADEYRVKCIRPDPGKGTPTGYMAKYVAKNVDGAGIIGDQLSDETGRPVVDDVARVVAWAQIHGIRQFQQIGGPPVGLWREHRRLSVESANLTIEKARQAALAGEWCRFAQVLMPKGAVTGRNTTVRLHFRSASEQNGYGEQRRPRLLGVISGGAIEITRPVLWKTQNASPVGALSSLGPVATTVRELNPRPKVGRTHDQAENPNQNKEFISNEDRDRLSRWDGT